MINENSNNYSAWKTTAQIFLGVAALLSIAKATAWYLYSDRQETLKPKVQVEQARGNYEVLNKTNSSPTVIDPETKANLEFMARYGINSTNGTITPFMMETLKRRIEQDRYRLANPDLFKGKPLFLWDQEYQSELERRATNPEPIKTPVKPEKPVKKKENYSTPVTPNLVTASMFAESNGNPNAQSGKGARGIIQVMPKTWEEQTKRIYGRALPFSEAYDAEKNLEVGTNYMKDIHNMLSRRLHGYNQLPVIEQQKRIVAAYNCGPERVIRNKGDIKRLPKETRNHVKKIERKMLAYSF